MFVFSSLPSRSSSECAVRIWPKATRNFSLSCHRSLMRCKRCGAHNKVKKPRRSITIVTTKMVFVGNFWLRFEVAARRLQEASQSKIEKNVCLIVIARTGKESTERDTVWPVLYYYGQSQVKKCTHRASTKQNEMNENEKKKKQPETKLHPEIFAQDRRAALPHNYAYLIAIWLYPSQPWHSNIYTSLALSRAHTPTTHMLAYYWVPEHRRRDMNSVI